MPETCDVCRAAIRFDWHLENEHASTNLATHILFEALDTVDGSPAGLPGLVTESFPPHDEGPQHTLRPRHYYWAIFHEPALLLSKREE